MVLRESWEGLGGLGGEGMDWEKWEGLGGPGGEGMDREKWEGRDDRVSG